MVLSVAVLSFWAGGRYGEERSAGTMPPGEPAPDRQFDEGQDDSPASSGSRCGEDQPGPAAAHRGEGRRRGEKADDLHPAPLREGCPRRNQALPRQRLDRLLDQGTLRRHHGKHRPKEPDPGRGPCPRLLQRPGDLSDCPGQYRPHQAAAGRSNPPPAGRPRQQPDPHGRAGPPEPRDHRRPDRRARQYEAGAAIPSGEGADRQASS